MSGHGRSTAPRPLAIGAEDEPPGRAQAYSTQCA